MAKLSVDHTLSKAKSYARKGKIEEAQKLYQNVLQAFPKNGPAQKGLDALNKANQLNATQNPPQELLHRLLGHYQNGRFSDAEKLAVFMTQEFPRHQFAWKVLGALFGATGRKYEAADANQTAVALSPQDAQAHYNLGNSLQELGRLEDAEASYNRAIALKPDYAKAHYNLGIVLQELGRSDEAEANYKQAIALKPDFSEAHSNLGNTLKELGRLEEAAASYERAIALRPNVSQIHSNLGITLQELGRLDDAAASYNQAIALKPDFVATHNNLGVTLKELGRLEEAEASYKRAISFKPDFAEAHSNLGSTLQELGRLEEAEASHNQAIALKPDYAEAHNNFGVTLKELGRLEEAETSYTQAIALKPGYAEAHKNMGITLQEVSRIDEAEAFYTQAIALKPNFAEAYRMLASIKKFDAHDEHYLLMQRLYLDEDISDDQRCHINFSLAKACEDLGNFEQAYAHYAEGNALRKKLLKYDFNDDVELFRKLKSNYPQIAQNSLAPDSFPNNLMPIFIVGMPRSGTTLVEQIISSHSEVTGAGELNFVAQFGATIAIGVTEANHESLLDFRHKYLNRLQNVSDGNLIVTDKMPQNFYYIGLLAAAFPEAKIIHVKRNPAAVCWSNYKHYFGSKGVGYCYAIDDVTNYHTLYENLMDFWTNTLSDRIYQLDYEQLTVNQESETRQLIEHLKLDWDEKCLSPQNNARSVATASNVQVRKKVYKGSSEQWKKYLPFLNGAFDCFL